jgi:hypothetical protein
MEDASKSRRWTAHADCGASGGTATYAIIPTRHPPGDVVWWCLWRESPTGSGSATEISRHADQAQAEAARARCLRLSADVRAERGC